MDGDVVQGTSHVNQAPITGESRAVEKRVGNGVFAGSINGEGTLEVTVTRRAEDNTISRLVQLVAEAQENRAPVERLVDRFARIYTPSVVALAVLTAVVPPLLFGAPFWGFSEGSPGWLYRSLALLVVACPCALVISTPVSVVSAITNGARSGVLVKGGEVIETLARVRALALDKTGTITEGRPTVVKVRSTECLAPGSTPSDESAHSDACESCTELVALASAVERRSEHPLAKAIVVESERRGVAERYPAAQSVTALGGQGVTGTVAGRTVTVGSHRLFDSTVPHGAEHCRAVSAEADTGRTAMMVGAEGSFLGMIAVTDAVRRTGAQAVEELRAEGIEPVVMLTGDDDVVARAVAAEIGITEVRSGLLPGDKMDAVDELRRIHGSVAMVGDGINDAPALAAADVGIAIGAATGATTQAMETADIALMSDDLTRLPFTVRLAHATMSTIRTNIAASVLIKVLFLALVLAGMGTMWMAVLADMGTSLGVTLYGMRLLRWPRADASRQTSDLPVTPS
jgi:Cd2+/Zn2+-exporting ATPase